jgi:hypothetical protein
MRFRELSKVRRKYNFGQQENNGQMEGIPLLTDLQEGLL